MSPTNANENDIRFARSDTKPLVLHFIPTATARGAQREARGIVDQLNARGVSQHVLVCLFDGSEEVAVDLNLGLPDRRTSAQGFVPKAAYQLRKTLARIDPKMVVAHGGDALKYLVPAMLGRHRPLIYYAIGTFAGTNHRTMQVPLWRFLIHRADLVAAEGPNVEEECLELFRLPKDRVRLVVNGRDPQIFRPRSPEPSTRIPELIFVGAFTSGKRPSRFIDLVEAVKSTGLRARATMVGDGPLLSELEGRAKNAGINVLGSRSDVSDLLREADVFIFPSAPTGEGLPGVLIEAGLSGLPVVATSAPGVASIVKDGSTGLIVDIDDFEALKSATFILLEDDDLRAQMGAEARRHCSNHFTMTEVGSCWATLMAPFLAPISPPS